MDIEQARLLTLKTAWMMDNVDAKEARVWISMIKTVVPNVSIRIVDQAIQMYGALGISQDTPLAGITWPSVLCAWRMARTRFTAWWWDATSCASTPSRRRSTPLSATARGLPAQLASRPVPAR